MNYLSKYLNKENKVFFVRLLIAYIGLILASVALQSIVNTSFFIDELTYLGSPYYDLKSSAKALVYLISYSISIGLLLMVLLQRSTILLVILLAYILLLQLIDVSTQLIVNSSGFTVFHYILSLNEAGNYENLFIYFSKIKKALVITVVFGGVILMVRKFIRRRISYWWLIFLAPFCFLSVVVAKMGVHYIKYESYWRSNFSSVNSSKQLESA